MSCMLQLKFIPCSYNSVTHFIGIVPVTCEELFKGIENKAGTGVQYEVVLGMLEIYNEQVNTLLVNDSYHDFSQGENVL